MKDIQWFPGHMAKAKREIEEYIKKVDLVIELKDARIPYSSTNPLLNDIIKNKPRLVILTKAQMADPKVTKEWINYYKNNNILALDIDSEANYNIKQIIPYCNKALEELFKKRMDKGIKSKDIKAMIVGIPNVGKSTLINKLAKRKAVVVGDKPGVTKSESWIQIEDSLRLLDTPGVLWPKFEDQTVGLKLFMAGSIKDDILDLNELTIRAIDYIKEYYKDLLMKRYDLLDIDSKDSYQILEEIGIRRGALKKGGIIDFDRAVKLFLYDLRNVKIGRMSYETPQI